MALLRLPKMTLPDELLAQLRALAEREGAPAFAYARISQDRIGAGLGVDRQLEEQCDLVERLGLRLAGVYCDNDISAYSGKPRPDYRAMLADLRAGQALVITCWHTDRLHRSPVELEEFIGVCEPRLIVTHTVRAGHLDLATPSGRLVARNLGNAARFESEHKADRIKSAHLQAAKAGRRIGGARPFGFEVGGEVLRPSEAAEIERACDAILAGSSLRSQVAETNTRGLLTTFGNEWTPVSYRDMLVRPRNAGILVHQGKEFGKACWPAIVSEEKWRAVVAILTDPERKTSMSNRVRWFGSGIYRCGVCEQPEMRVSLRSDRNPSYRCRSKERGYQLTASAGPHVVRDAIVLDDFVERLLVRRLQRADARDLLKDPAEAVDTAALRAESLATRRNLETLDDDLDANRITRARWLRRNERMNARLKEIERELVMAATVDPLVGVAGADDVHAVWFGTKPDRSDGLNLGRRRAILDTMATVTVLPAVKGQHEGKVYFDPRFIQVDWKRGG